MCWSLPELLAVGQQNILIQVAESQKLQLAAPARVDSEIIGMCDSERSRTRISGMPARDRVRSKKSLGEIMVLAHASVYIQRGQAVFVLIDNGDGRRRASREVSPRSQWQVRL